MKKTIITLLALSGVAMGGTSTITLDNHTTSQSVIITAELSLNELTTILWTNSTNTALIGLKDSGNNQWATVVGTWSSKQEMLIFNGHKGGDALSGNSNVYYSGGNWPSDKNVGGIFSQEGAVKGAITLAYAGSNVPNYSSTIPGDDGTCLLVSVLYEDGTMQSLYGTRTGQKWSSNTIKEVTYADHLMSTPTVTLDNKRWTQASLTDAHEAILIPEPTTATLSLLALAGLAARRRRK